MEYHEAIDRLEGLRRLRPKLGTETTAGLLADLGDPHEGLTAVQVAGSNGKGSAASVLARILREAGLSVGLYTSPDLSDRRERVRVDGAKITKRAVVRFVEAAWPSVRERAVDGDAPTFFEACTAMALWQFDRQGVDVAVLEVGIGGRYDATSVVDPVAAAVTSVSLEHTAILGSTVEEIARDKAQVAPGDRPLVTGASGAALSAIREETDVVTVGGPAEDRSVADAQSVADGGSEEAALARAEESTDPDEDPPDVRAVETGMVARATSSVSVAGPDWAVEAETPLLGQHQAANVGVAAALARQVAEATGATVTERDLAAGIRNVEWPGRFELIGERPLTILDGAHNPAACERTAELLDRFDYDDLLVAFGAMREKDHARMARALSPVDRVVLTEPAVDRAADPAVLEGVFDRETDAATERCPSVAGAVDRLLRAADPGDCVLVTGSLYAVGEARDRWTRTPTPVRTDTAAQARAVMESADVPARRRRELADRLVGETVRLRTRSAGAAQLKASMTELGGTCAVSGVEAPAQAVDVVLSGTREQFVALVRDLRGRPGECRSLAAQLSDALETGAASAGGSGPATRRTDDAADARYPWTEGTAVMGILNVTPDSFHDGGEYEAVDDAVARAEAMVAEGADVVDVGGESTRPGADPVPVETERERVLPVVERLNDLDALVSVDTRKPAVAAAALEAGADLVNDVTGLADAAMRRVVADHGAPVVLMHSRSVPVDPDRGGDYDDVVADVFDALSERILLAERAGIDRSDIVVDPGLGFGKTAAESFALLDRLDEFRALGTPVMVGHSHKSMFERVARPSDDRFAPTVAATALAVQRGADIVRVHDVAPNAAAVATAERTTRE